MSIPSKVSSGQAIASGTTNSIIDELVSIRSDALIWKTNVDAGAHTLSNVIISSIAQNWAGAVNGGGNTLSNVTVAAGALSTSGLVQLKNDVVISGGSASKGAGLVVNTTAGDPVQGGLILQRRVSSNGAFEANLLAVNLSTGYVGLGIMNPLTALHVNGSISTNANFAASSFVSVAPADAGVLLYNNGSGNWAGIGADFFGRLWLRAATSGTSHANMVFTPEGWIVGNAPNSICPDSYLFNGAIAISLDESGNNLKFRVKYSTGVLKTGTLALV